MVISYKIYNGTTLLATVTAKSYTVTGLKPVTSYTLGVVPNNGLRDGTKASVTFKTRGIQFVIPETLTVGDTGMLRYQEYSLGLVPIGTEPTLVTSADAGADGKTPCLHIAYADSADGKDGFYVGGGTNLLLGTNNVLTAVTDATGWNERLPTYELAEPLNDDQTYTMSCYLEPESHDAAICMNSEIGNLFGTTIPAGSKGVSTFTFTNKDVNATGEFWVTFTNEQTDESTIAFKEFKLEKGDKATPWSPAPEDNVQSKYMGTYTDYTQADSTDPNAYEWKQNAGDVAASVPKTMFGGGNKKSLPFKVVSTTNGSSVVELTTSDTSFADQTKLTKQSNGVYAAFSGYKAIYYG